jgi:hypothetical protein
MSDNEIPEFIRKLMPHATEAELTEAAENFRGYISVILRIYERIRRDQARRDSSQLKVCDRLKNTN